MTRDMGRALSRLGQIVPIWSESNTGTEDEFGQDEQNWSKRTETLSVRSYQNRNTTMNSSGGELDRDRPVLFFPADNYPRSGERIKYDGQWYEVDSPTVHRTHAVAMGSIVRDNTFPP